MQKWSFSLGQNKTSQYQRNLIRGLSGISTHHNAQEPGRAAQSVARQTQEPEVPGSIPGPVTYMYYHFSFR